MRKISLLLLLFFPLLSFSQKEGQGLIDSLLQVLPKMKEDTLKVTTLNELSTVYRYIDCELGLKYGNKAWTLSKQLQWKDGIATSYNSIGTNYIAMSDFANAERAFRNAIRASKNKRSTSTALKNIGVINTSQGNYSEGLAYCFRALKISEIKADKKEIASIYSLIGSNYIYLDKIPKAIIYCQKSLKISEQMGIKLNMSSNLLSISHCYLKLNQNNKAILFCNKSLKINLDLGNKKGIVNNYSSLAAIYLRLQDYQKTLEYSQKALSLAKKIDSHDFIALNAGIISDVYLELAKKELNKVQQKNLLDNSENYCLIALDIDKKKNNLLELSTNYETLSSIQELKGDYKKALDSYKNSAICKDSIYNSDNKETIKNLEDKRTIELRDKEIKINKLTLDAKEKQKGYFIFGIIMLGIIGGLLLYQSNNRKKTNQKLKILNADLDHANKVKAKVLSILNHDLRSPVNSFIHYIQLKKENPELLDDATKLRIENTTIASAKNLLNSMEDILLWTKDQMENFGPQPKKLFISSLFENMKNHFSNAKNVQISYENPNDIQLTTDENYLKIIIRNLTDNAIKALEETKNPTILWKAWQEENQNYLSITDNGKGGIQEQFEALYTDTERSDIQSGLGLHLIRDLTLAIDCKITVETKENQGTTFTLILP